MSAHATLPKDFIGLPIIISDYDALTSNNSTGPSPTSSPQQHDRQASTSSTSTTASSAASYASQQNWSTGFSDFADDLWAKMTTSMKKKLRGACVEVLKKTEDVEPEGMSWQYDEDARFLD